MKITLNWALSLHFLHKYLRVLKKIKIFTCAGPKCYDDSLKFKGGLLLNINTWQKWKESCLFNKPYAVL